MLAQFGFCLMLRQNISDKLCSDRQLQFLSKQQILGSNNAEPRHHFMVKERVRLYSLSEENHHTDGLRDQMMEYQSS